MTDDPLTTCPQCGGEIHRVLFPAGIVFKGSGFYKTEYSSYGRSGNQEASVSKAEAGENKSTPEIGKSASESKKSESGSGASAGSSAPTTTAAD